MFDIMLIDDDIRSRTELKKNIQWQTHGVQLLCEAEDSQTAKELYLLYRPKIIIANMSVPLLFDLEQAAQLQKEDPQIQFIITDHDFDFAKQPLDLRNVNLLRKPVRNQNLNYCLSKAVRQLEADRERQLKELKRFLHHKTNGDAVGFSNSKYFSYVFKQATGQTPLEYQKKVQKGERT